jgi:hypothetical protein
MVGRDIERPVALEPGDDPVVRSLRLVERGDRQHRARARLEHADQRLEGGDDADVDDEHDRGDLESLHRSILLVAPVAARSTP